MQREIKFRAFHPEENKMYEIDLLAYMCMNESAQDDDMPSAARHNGLMQYTGLKDKNGKEIYEGDIVETDRNKKRWVVVFEDFGFALDNETIERKFAFAGRECYPLGSYLEMLEAAGANLEVVGNIYEHPHLLTQQ